MSCRRVHDIDLPAFLANPRAPEFSQFRAHYPACAECAAEIRVWTELAGALASSGPAHPAPEQLAAFAAAGLPGTQRAALEAHLEGCASCRDEVEGLTRFAPERLEPDTAASPRPTPGESWTDALRRLLWHPALAYGLVLALVAPWLYRTLVSGPDPATPLPVEVAVLERSADESFAEAPREGNLEQQEPTSPPPPPRVSKRAPARAETPVDALEEADALAQAKPDPAPTPADPEPTVTPMPSFAARKRAEPSSERFDAQGRAAGSVLAQESADAAAPLADETRERSHAIRPVFELSPGRTLRLQSQWTRAGITLAVPLPPGAGPGDTAELRVTSPDGSREIREQRSWDEPPVSLELQIPSGWLHAGPYRVQVDLVSPNEPAPLILHFDVLP